MKKIWLLILFFNFHCFAQENGFGYELDGVSIQSFTYENFRSLLQKSTDTTYVVNFWATWCAPCVKELPYFERLNLQYRDRKVKVILVSLDMKKQIESNLLPFIRRKKLRSTVIHLYAPDADAWIGDVDSSWTGAIPATVIYNKKKKKFFEQSFADGDLENEVKQFIN